MTKRMIIMLLIVGALFGGLFGFKAMLGGIIRKSIAEKGIPPQTVSTAKAQLSEWQGEFQAVGTLRAVRGADIAPELPGVVTAIQNQANTQTYFARDSTGACFSRTIEAAGGLLTSITDGVGCKHDHDGDGDHDHDRDER